MPNSHAAKGQLCISLNVKIREENQNFLSLKKLCRLSRSSHPWCEVGEVKWFTWSQSCALTEVSSAPVSRFPALDLIPAGPRPPWELIYLWSKWNLIAVRNSILSTICCLATENDFEPWLRYVNFQISVNHSSRNILWKNSDPGVIQTGNIDWRGGYQHVNKLWEQAGGEIKEY